MKSSDGEQAKKALRSTSLKILNAFENIKTCATLLEEKTAPVLCSH